jgi:hypothetical protein
MSARTFAKAGVPLLILGLLGIGAGIVRNASTTVTAGEALPAARQAAAPAEDATKTAPLPGPRSRQVHKWLAQSVTLEFEPNTPLKEALQTITDKYKVTFAIDNTAFEAIGVQKPEEHPVQLPKVTNVRLARVLPKLLKQIKGDVYHGTFQVRPDRVEITTTYHQMAESPAAAPEHPALIGAGTSLLPAELWGDPLRKITPVVHLDADHRPIGEVLRDLADDLEMDLVIDRRAAEKARTAVDLTLNNALLDTTLTLLVDLAELDWMWFDNVIFVSTKEDIKARKERKKAQEQDKARMLREAHEIQGLVPGGTPGGLLPPGLPGGAGPAFPAPGLLPAPPPAKPLPGPQPVPRAQ